MAVPIRFSPVPEIRTYFQRSVTIPEALVEPEYDDPKIREVVKKAYPSGFFYIPEDLHKTIRFYEFILVDTNFVEITHILSRDDPSTMRFCVYFQIPLILTWNFQIKETEDQIKQVFKTIKIKWWDKYTYTHADIKAIKVWLS